MASMSDIAVHRDGATQILRFNRPGKMNALTGAMYDAVLPESWWAKGLWLMSGGAMIGFGARAAGEGVVFLARSARVRRGRTDKRGKPPGGRRAA